MSEPFGNVEHANRAGAPFARPPSGDGVPGPNPGLRRAFEEMFEAPGPGDTVTGNLASDRDAWSGPQLYVAEDCRRLLDQAISAGEEVVTITVKQLAAFLEMADRVSKWGLA